MTRAEIAEGLSILVEQLANNFPTGEPERDVPAGFQPHEWAYIKGIASHAILQSRAWIITAGESRP